MEIVGYFNERNEPVIKLDLGGLDIEVLVDTGFDGSLIVPTKLAEGLDLKFEGPEEFLSVTGEIVSAFAHSMEIDWLGKRIRIPVATSPEVNEALLGGRLLKDSRLTIDYGHRSVTITES